MSDNGAIPQNIYSAIKAWIEQRKTGQIALNMNDGRVVNAELKEKLAAK